MYLNADTLAKFADILAYAIPESVNRGRRIAVCFLYDGKKLFRKTYTFNYASNDPICDAVLGFCAEHGISDEFYVKFCTLKDGVLLSRKKGMTFKV